MPWSHTPPLIRTSAILATFVLAAPQTSAAQFPPDSAVNLEVLPQDIEIRALIGIMRDFAIGLGVRCQFCHVGEEAQPLSEFDFPSERSRALGSSRRSTL